MMNYSSLFDGLRVLVVDGHPDSAELLSLLFEPYGIETITVESADKALEKLSHTPPDLLISELRLPGEDGYWLMRNVKDFELAHQTRIPAIALTAALSSERDRALAAGFCQYISKPFDLEALLVSITAVACSCALR